MKGDNMKNKRNKMDPIGNLVRHGSFSAKWTTFFALIAMFSILTLGITQVSLAAGLDDLPNQLTNTSIDDDKTISGTYMPHGGVNLKYAMMNGTKIPVYCLEVWKFYGRGYTYSKASNKTYLDNGVVALLTYANSGMWNKNLQENIDSTKREQAITQLALWVYLYQTNSSFKTEANTVHSDLEESTPSMTDDMVSQLLSSSYGTDINKLVQYAKAHASEYGDPVVQISKADGDFTLDSTGNYMVSPEMTLSVTPTGTLKSYSIGLSNAPEGTKVVVEGNEYSASELASKTFTQSGMNITVKVPKDQVTETTKKFNIDVNTTHEYYVGLEYAQDGNDKAQRIAAGAIQPKNASTSLPLEVIYKVEVPETAQNSSMTLYIVGLIVLLSGIGVIYANVKPAREK